MELQAVGGAAEAESLDRTEAAGDKMDRAGRQVEGFVVVLKRGEAWAKAGGQFGLWALLVETAELDTEKHITMLKYLRRLITGSETAG